MLFWEYHEGTRCLIQSRPLFGAPPTESVERCLLTEINIGSAVRLPEVQEVSQSQTWLPSSHRHPRTARLCCHKTNLSLSSRYAFLLVKFIFVAHFQERQWSWTNISSRHKNQQMDTNIYKNTKQYSRTYTGGVFFISFRTAVVLRMSRSCQRWQWYPLPRKILQHHCLIVQG